jgi:hypothetical protein
MFCEVRSCKLKGPFAWILDRPVNGNKGLDKGIHHQMYFIFIFEALIFNLSSIVEPPNAETYLNE